MMMEKKGRKRSRLPAGSVAVEAGRGDDKLTKRQRRSAGAEKTPYFAPKPSSSLLRRVLDVPPERWTPQERVDLIADLSESILEDPSSALTSSRVEVSSSPSGGGVGSSRRANKKKDVDDDDGVESSKKEPQYHKTQSKVNQLIDIASISRNGHDARAARLAVLSLLAIFQDILPGYRIRLPTEAEASVRVTKEVKATWDYERKLLQAYQRYLQLLERTWEEGKSGRRWSDDRGKKGNKNQGGGPPTTLAATAILALSALLKTSYNFNFRTNILQVVVRHANHRSSEEVRCACCDALSTMFARDARGDASLEAVRLMAKMIKQQSANNSNNGNNRGSNVRPELLNTWLSLPLRVHEDEAAAARLAAAAKAKRAKKSQADKDALDIEKEMKEGEASVDKLELARNQADCLHAVTLTYFRILKSVANDDAGQGGNGTALGLLPCALRGLARFSHLIHMDAVVDLLAVLKELLKNASCLPPDTAMHCILCAFRTLRGPGRETLPVDPKEYLIPLYNLLPRLGVTGVIESGNKSIEGGLIGGVVGADESVEAAIQCLDHAFLQRRELSTSRLAAFLKRVSSSALHCPPLSSAPLLAAARQISSRNRCPKVERMLENEEDVVAEGVYAPDAEDPEHANAHGTSLWELALLRHSVHPGVAEQAVGMAEGRLLKLPREAPLKMLARMGRDAKEGYIPQRPVWKKHPLDNRVQSSDDGGASTGGDSRRKALYDVAAEEGKSRKKRRQQRRNQNQVRFITPRRTGNWHLLPATSYSIL